MATVKLDLDRLRTKDLPDCCMRCGADAELRVEKRFSWHPPWVFALILCALLPYIIVAMILRKSVNVPVPLCQRHRGHWTTRDLVIWVGFGLIAVLFGVTVKIARILEDQFPKGAPSGSWGAFVFMGVLILGVLWLIIAMILQARTIKPTLIDEDDIELTNVSSEFVEALKERRRELKRRRMTATATMSADTIACPYCGETIKATATRCRYCKEDLDEEDDEYD